jgi:anti-sigma B factor antagonist
MFDIRRQDDVTVVEAMGHRVDMETSATFKATLEKLIAAGDRRIVINLGQVTFMDSAGLGAIMSVFKQLNGGAGSLQVCGLQPRIRTLFDITRLSRVIGLHETEADALAAARN